jgi:hypothetical protein
VIGLSRDASHVYTAAYETTEILSSVTTILRVLDKPALVPWAQGIVAEAAIAHRGDIEGWVQVGGVEGAIGLLKKAATAQRDRAAATGTDVHALAESLNRGLEVIVPADIAPFVDAYRRWVDRFQPTVIAAEELIAGDGYAGTFDLIADIAGERWLLDIKTSKGVYSDTALQLAAYGRARYIGRPGDPVRYAMPAIEQYGVVHVRPEGAELVPYDVTDEDYRTFQALQVAAKWRETRAKAVVGQPIGPALLSFPNQVREAIA